MDWTQGNPITVASATFDGTTPGTSYAQVGNAVNTIGWNSLCMQLSTGTPSGAAETLDVKLQDSCDGTVWTDNTAFTQVTTAAGGELKRLTTFGPYVRFVAKVGGTTPSYPTTKIIIASR